MTDHMKALNRAFEKAFAHRSENDTIEELLSCMGEELGCDRISIFEENEAGFCDNTYEWCRSGVVHEQILLQHIAISRFDTWHDRLVNNEIILVTDPSDLKDHDPDVYQAFLEQGITSAIVALLAFHGKNFGFFILENPHENVMADKEMIMPGIRYILSSLIYSRNLISRLRRIGYTDTLTGAGNRISLQEHLEKIDLHRAMGLICLDVIGWVNDDGKLPHLEKEQTILRTGDILMDLFDEEHVFRMASGVFLILQDGIEKSFFEQDLARIRVLLREQNVLASAVGKWIPEIPDSVDELIHNVQLKADEERRILLNHRVQFMHSADAQDSSRKAKISIPRGDEFFRLAEHYLASRFEDQILCVVTDINYFNLYNDIFGRSSGNIFLESTASILREHASEQNGICGYIGGDNFCLILPTKKKETAQLQPLLEAIYNTFKFPDGFSLAMGAYLSDDRRETMISLYDKALNALSEIKGNYLQHIHFYSAESHRHQKEDKILLMKVREGLKREEFVFYIQPQVHEKSGKIIGGEALVRWRQEGRLISPGQFIPILEKTGYVYAVDTCVWESVARWLRDLIDRGITPVPISVNVSRVDFYFCDVAEYFINLIRTYDLDPGLIGIEITESAFTENMDLIMDCTRRLHKEGFHILMDDFGSGSSSLSMLHTMNLDVLKTDVQFMSQDERDNRAISIVESVISMAHMIGLSVVTEGVETKQQKENLIALGDSFAQGFYFYSPMPKEAFEELIRDRAMVTTGYERGRISISSQLRFREMIKEGLVSETLLNNIIRAAAIYRLQSGKLTIVQINDAFAELTGMQVTEEEMSRFETHLEKAQLEKFRSLLEEADTHTLGGSEGVILFQKDSGEEIELKMRVFLLYTYEDHRIYLSTMS